MPTALNVSVAIEGKGKAAMLEEALRLRQALMGESHQTLIKAASVVRFADDRDSRLRAIDTLSEEAAGATPGGSVTVRAALERLRQRALQPA